MSAGYRRPVPRLSPTSRRAAIGTAVATAVGLALTGAGCSFGSLDPTSEDPTLTPSDGASPTDNGTDTGVDADADTALLEAAALAVSSAHHAVRTNLRLHPDLDGVLRPLERLHRTHARELGGLQEVTGSAADPAEAPRQVLARIAKVEAGLQRALVRDATRAESGALALLLASVAAAVAQRGTTLVKG